MAALCRPLMTAAHGDRIEIIDIPAGEFIMGGENPTAPQDKGMIFRDKDGEFRGYGLYAALSYDEGRTWPVRKLLTDGVHREPDGGAWTGPLVMDSTHAEPRGYMEATQTPDNVIHLISSRLCHSFNLE